jgi:hypothetical protein
MFLLDEDTPSHPQFMDANTGEGESGQRIKAFRDRVRRERLVKSFHTDDDLAYMVAVSVRALEARGDIGALELPDTLRSLHSVDLRQGDSDSFERLVRAIRGSGSARTA